MRALFCHDNLYIHAGDGRVYSEGQFAYAQWQRYLAVFSTLTVVGRGRPLDANDPVERFNVASGPRVTFLQAPHFASPSGLVRRRRQAAALMADAIDTADAVIVRLPSEIGLLAATLSRRLGKPLAVELVTCAWDALWNYGTWQAQLYAPLQAWRVRRAVYRAPFTIYVTREFLQRRYPTRGESASASNVEIDPPDGAVLARRLDRIRTPRGKVVFGLIGSLHHRYKGLHTALDALARVRRQLPPFELRVLGPGDVRPWQEEAAARGLTAQVRFCGVLPSGAPVLGWLDEVDLYLQPSFQEGVPRAMIEAMSRGCPALGSTAGGIPELLPGECLHEPGDAPRLATLIEDAVQDPAWLALQAQRNFTLSKQYAADALVPRRNAFWQSFGRHVARQAEQAPAIATRLTRSG